MIHQLQAYLHGEPFEPPQIFAVPAVLLFSLSGVFAAMRRGYDVVGVFILALVTGVGGGLLRDVLFLQQGRPEMIRNWRLLPAVLGACFIGWMVHAWIVRFEKPIAVLDAVGLSVFSMIGLIKSIEAGLSVPASMLVGVINASGGGLLRDLFTGEEPLLFKPGQFYVLASLAGCAVFVWLAYGEVVKPRAAERISIVTIFVLRLLAIIFNWRTAPLRPWFTTPGPSPGDPGNTL